MGDNYKDTIYRMYESSCTLHDKEQWFNANYLAGYVLECFCKLLLEKEDNKDKSANRKMKNYGHNVEKLADEIDLLAHSGTYLTKYRLELGEECSNIIREWNPFYRYRGNSYKLGDSELAKQINSEITILINKIIEMEIDGVFR